MTNIQRRPSLTTKVGGISIGGCNPIVVQSMTNTDTCDVSATVSQVEALAQAGSELVRITVHSKEAAAAVPEIVERLAGCGINVPIIGDFHYNGHILLREFPDCAKSLAKYRINPGNVGMGRHRDTNFETIIKIANEHNKPIRIGVNWGSLDQTLVTDLMNRNGQKTNPKNANDIILEAMVISAMQSVEMATHFGMESERIILSAKVSRVNDLIHVYRELASKSECPLHLGLTEAGMGRRAIVSSTAALSILLNEGIGDTIRVSLTPPVNGDRAEEVRVCQEILQTLGLQAYSPQITACPGCGRTTSTLFQEMAHQIEEHVRNLMPMWKTRYLGVEELNISVMGCIVNGPGESKHANIGISLPGTGEEPKAPVYVDSQLMTTLKGDNIVEEFLDILDDYVNTHFTNKINE